MAYRSKSKKNSRFIVMPDVRLKLTRKEFLKANERFMVREKMLNKKFKRMRKVK